MDGMVYVCSPGHYARDLAAALSTIKTVLSRSPAVRGLTAVEAAEGFWKLVAQRPRSESILSARSAVARENPALARRCGLAGGQPSPDGRRNTPEYVNTFLMLAEEVQRQNPKWPGWKCRAAVKRQHPGLADAAWAKDPSVRYQGALLYESQRADLSSAYESAAANLPEDARIYLAQGRS